MASLARQLNRRHEIAKAENYKASGRWEELLRFCRAHESHGEMEYQLCEHGSYMACLLCGESFDCGDLSEPLFNRLLGRFNFSFWLSA